MTDFEDFEKQIEHPLEESFDIEQGTTMTTTKKAVPTGIVAPEDYDRKDKEIDDQLQEVYELALEEFENQTGRIVEGKFAARNGEVAALFLNTALNAAKEKASIKMNKDKLVSKVRPSSVTQNLTQNNIVADRNDILDLLEDAEDVKDK